MENLQTTQNTITVVLNTEFFRKFKDGSKTSEYREVTDYWKKRIEQPGKKYLKVINGYRSKGECLVFKIKEIDITEVFNPIVGKTMVMYEIKINNGIQQNRDFQQSEGRNSKVQAIFY